MSALEDAKRFIHLEGLVTSDDPIDLLKRIVVEYHPRHNEQLVREHRIFREKIDELERQLQSSKAHTSYLEVALKNQIELHAECQTVMAGSPSYKKPMTREGRRL